ncbi:uncharacterized protein BJ212DRAFT_903430 [Suillus subaureus]|uniref:Uncharacterized protein n=1 Tax=Suillus subaureus TaxID=48587 RepID=A0A9P7JGJ4_9AGAM|nr:uncharacterized protein BJ212DRAFT_903430 [Suillus subaureus]KAG1821528.1 hypothetical protein BJ212DRAFT_903430 [Suillus subaureus]
MRCLNNIFLCPKLPPLPPVTETAVTYHYDIIDTASKKWARLSILCAVIGHAGTFTSVDDVTTPHTGAIFNDLGSAIFRTVLRQT